MNRIVTGNKIGRQISRRSLMASAMAFGVCGIAALAGSACTNDNNGKPSDGSSAEDDLHLNESDLIRPKRAVPQGEYAEITGGGDSKDVLVAVDFKGTIRLRVVSSWLYETKEAFERSEGVDIDDNWADERVVEEYEEQQSYYETHPDELASKLAEAQDLKDGTGFVDQLWRVEDLQKEYDELSLMCYAEDWSIIPVTTQVLIDAGYKLLTFDLEIDNVNASNMESGIGSNPDSIMLPELARGSDVAVMSPRFYLSEGENEPSADTYEELRTWNAALVPRGENRLIHVVWVVSPRSLKGELSLFMGMPIWQPTIPDNVVLLALEPQTVS